MSRAQSQGTRGTLNTFRGVCLVGRWDRSIRSVPEAERRFQTPIAWMLTVLVSCMVVGPLKAQCGFEETRLESTRRVSNAYFGQSIAADRDVVVVGQPFGMQFRGKTGLAHVYRRVAGEWTLETTLAPPSLQEFDAFGHEVAIHGKTIAVSAIQDKEAVENAGAVYLFRFDGEEWIEEQKLLPFEGVPGLEFGDALALGRDLLLVSAPWDRRKGGGVVYAYHFDGVRWSREADIFSPNPGGYGHFGSSVALSGNVAAIGEPNAWDGWTRHGIVSIFRRVPGKGWTLEQMLPSRDGHRGSSHGASLALDESWLLVGDPTDIPQGSTYGGAVDVFHFDGSQWIFRQKLRAPDPREGRHFGQAVALSGNRALIGQTNAPSDLGGMAYVFRNHGGTFLAERRFSSQKEDDLMGAAVAISGDSYWAGAPEIDEGIHRSFGVAYVFERDPILLELVGLPAAGQPVQFQVSSATGREEHRAVVLLSCSDGAAGIDLPGDQRFVPLTFDACTSLSLTFGPLLQGTIDVSGTATTPRLPFPNIAAGIRFWASGVTVDVATGKVSSVLCRITFESQ